MKQLYDRVNYFKILLLSYFLTLAACLWYLSLSHTHRHAFFFLVFLHAYSDKVKYLKNIRRVLVYETNVCYYGFR